MSRVLRGGQLEQAFLAEDAVTHCILGNHQGAETVELVLRFHSEIEQLNGAHTFGLESNADSVAEVG